jgi:hypothetical protein
MLISIPRTYFIFKKKVTQKACVSNLSVGEAGFLPFINAVYYFPGNWEVYI